MFYYLPRNHFLSPSLDQFEVLSNFVVFYCKFYKSQLIYNNIVLNIYDSIIKSFRMPAVIGKRKVHREGTQTIVTLLESATGLWPMLH